MTHVRERGASARRQASPTVLGAALLLATAAACALPPAERTTGGQPAQTVGPAQTPPGGLCPLDSRAATELFADGHMLVHRDGTPFLWIADTAWELVHRLDRGEAERYLDDRRAKSFTVIQTVLLASLGGFNSGNAYGQPALVDGDPARPATSDATEPHTYDYWQHVDFVVDAAGQRGLYVALMPTWAGEAVVRVGPTTPVFTGGECPGIWAVPGGAVPFRAKHCLDAGWGYASGR